MAILKNLREIYDFISQLLNASLDSIIPAGGFEYPSCLEGMQYLAENMHVVGWGFYYVSQENLFNNVYVHIFGPSFEELEVHLLEGLLLEKRVTRGTVTRRWISRL